MYLRGRLAELFEIDERHYGVRTRRAVRAAVRRDRTFRLAVPSGEWAPAGIEGWSTTPDKIFGALTAHFVNDVGVDLWVQTSAKSRTMGLFTTPPASTDVLVGSSAKIDGRIVDVVASGFLAGLLIVPRFVLGELQHIADDVHPGRRNRGRRGMDVLSVLQKDHRIEIEMSADDEPSVSTVDAKLVALALRRDAAILTTDYNLNRVAQLQGVRVMNLNQLANALKPAFLPGEELRVKVIQEGKEPGQGVAFLDDGTMVVVEGGSEHIEGELDVTVTRILQTVAGRMIFAEMAPTS